MPLEPLYWIGNSQLKETITMIWWISGMSMAGNSKMFADSRVTLSYANEPKFLQFYTFNVLATHSMNESLKKIVLSLNR